MAKIPKLRARATGPDSLVVVGSRPGRAIPKALKMVLVAPLLTLALKGSARR